mgnify:CR=1 FL=1
MFAAEKPMTLPPSSSMAASKLRRVRRSLIDIVDLSVEEITGLIDTANDIIANPEVVSAVVLCAGAYIAHRQTHQVCSDGGMIFFACFFVKKEAEFEAEPQGFTVCISRRGHE